jgi:Na+/alanine symporter
MKVLMFFTLAVLFPITLMGISQIPLVQDLVSASGFSSTEVFSGMAGIIFLLTVLVAIVDGVR